jgi:hypothetical protein
VTPYRQASTMESDERHKGRHIEVDGIRDELL